MKNNNLLICLFLISTVAFGQKQFPSKYQPGTYMPGRVIFKLLPETRPTLVMEEGQLKTFRLTDVTLQKICAAQGSYTVKALFPQHWGRAAGKVDLSLLGELEFHETANVPALCRQLMATGKFEFVEPRIIFKATGGIPENWADIRPSLALPCSPNDPMLGQQWHLDKIKAFDACDIEQGDTSVLIAIVDTGVDYNHPDLAGNTALNYADPVNGVDDDGNGFVDDYRGWDFYSNDNNPIPANWHGTSVAGVAAAVTNNGIGLAAPAMNSRFVAIKCSSNNASDLNISYGYEGIVYAADRGCKIINCSWGGAGVGSSYLTNVINYALGKNALIISSAGNENYDIPFQPASNEFVMSVAASSTTDTKTPYSNYNHYVDIAAPGSIMVTMPNGQYSSTIIGTSLSAPLVSSAAAILSAFDPSLTGLQLGERLRVTSDNIEAQNPNYSEQLGKGRLNIFRALTEDNSPAVRFLGPLFTDGNDNIFTMGDTIRLSGTFINYLANVSNLTVTLSTPNPDFIFLNNSYTIASLTTLSEVNNGNEPFQVVVGANIPPDTELPIRMHFQAAGYDDWQWLIVKTNQTYIDINNGVLATTITSEGRVGYDFGLNGLGIQYIPNSQILAVVGLMLGNNTTNVSDAALNNWALANPYSNDFKIVEPIRPTIQPLADIDIHCVFNDSSAVPTPSVMGLSVRQQTYAWTGDHFIINEYEITNNSDNEYNTFHVGLWGELDVYPFSNNRAEQDSTLHLAYVYNTSQPSPYIGIQLLGQTPYNLYAYDYTTNSGSVNLIDNFSTAEKYKTLTENRPAAGFGNPDGEDVGLVVGSGPFQLAPGAILKVAFAILAADSLEALKSAAAEANLRYDGLFPSNTMSRIETAKPLKIYPNPTQAYINIQVPESISKPCEISLFDAQGKLVERRAFSNGQAVQVGHLPSGFYSVKLTDGVQVYMGKFIKQ